MKLCEKCIEEIRQEIPFAEQELGWREGPDHPSPESECEFWVHKALNAFAISVASKPDDDGSRIACTNCGEQLHLTVYKGGKEIDWDAAWLSMRARTDIDA